MAVMAGVVGVVGGWGRGGGVRGEGDLSPRAATIVVGF